MTVSHSPCMLLTLEKCIVVSHVTLETVPRFANIERPTSSQLYASKRVHIERNKQQMCMVTTSLTWANAANTHIHLLIKLIKRNHACFNASE